MHARRIALSRKIDVRALAIDEPAARAYVTGLGSSGGVVLAIDLTSGAVSELASDLT